MDSDDMRNYIQNFSLDKCKLGNQGYNRVLLQLFGFAGHGKSSFINSCKYVIDDGPYKNYATTASAGNSQGGKTMKRSSYELTKTITLVDNRGCAKMNKDETGEIYAQLGNVLPLDTEVTWDTGFENTLTNILNSEREDRSADFIVPVFIYNSETRMSDEEFSELKKILVKANEITGLFPTVILTHETSELLPEIKEKFRRMGTQNIFTLENYSEKNMRKTQNKHETILKCLCEIVKDVEFRMEDIRDPKEEKTARKKILHRFIIKREIERIREAGAIELERERERERARETGNCTLS
ncbi:uncharacterized protein LOC143923384 isoform X1 [Lithobates pipiens]